MGLTGCIKHWEFGGYSNILPLIKLGLTRQESSPHSPTISYSRCCNKRNNDNATKIFIPITDCPFQFLL